MPRAKKSLPVAAPQDQGYGQRGEQMAAQRAIPLPNRQAQNAPTAGPTAAPGPASLADALSAAQGMVPPTGGLDAPTAYPDQPLTAGLPMGAGPGPEAIPLPVDPVLDYLRAAYRDFPTDSIRQLIEAAENGG